VDTPISEMGFTAAAFGAAVSGLRPVVEIMFADFLSLVIDTLGKAGQLTEVFQVTGVGATLDGRNGGGDRYFTDGELTIAMVSPGNKAQLGPPKVRQNPPAIQTKNDVMSMLRPLVK
ncbi:MAG TPA: hypothetical protein PK867_05665, partial [Pirellulales bacterium]|nr:hypothetical protein [Pirellulales bacterium]